MSDHQYVSKFDAMRCVIAIARSGVTMEAIAADPDCLLNLVEQAKKHTKHVTIDVQLSDESSTDIEQCAADDLDVREMKRALKACGIEVES